MRSSAGGVEATEILDETRQVNETEPLHQGGALVPSPQSLVTFVTLLFVLLIATRAPLGIAPVPGAILSLVLAFACAVVVDRRVPDEDDDEDITLEAGRDVEQP